MALGSHSLVLFNIGSWGSYSGQPVFCGTEARLLPSYIMFKSEFNHSTDNAGGVNVRFVCGREQPYNVIEGNGARSFGYWDERAAVCGKRQYLCGFRPFVQVNQGPAKDDMGLVGFDIACCRGPPPIRRQRKNPNA